MRKRMVWIELIAVFKISDGTLNVWIDVNNIQRKIVFLVRKQKSTDHLSDVPKPYNAYNLLHVQQLIDSNDTPIEARQ